MKRSIAQTRNLAHVILWHADRIIVPLWISAALVLAAALVDVPRSS
ncbi:hypothetical protein LSUCC0031_08375 [Rhodobacterales bacterium LSUCC0031]|nr:hypothetical protein [Rhodobacterales bacterium LSUCC0031]